MGGHARLAAARRVIEAAPWTGLHAFGNRAFAIAAMKARVELLAELPLELAPLNLPPRRTATRAVLRPGALLLAGPAVQPLEVGPHLDGIAVTLGRIELNGFLQQFYQLGTDARFELVVTRQRPFERPLGKRAREHAIQHEPHREHVGLELRPSHGLLRCDVVDGP